jgi:hypothetical protein
MTSLSGFLTVTGIIRIGQSINQLINTRIGNTIVREKNIKKNGDSSRKRFTSASALVASILEGERMFGIKGVAA